MEESQAPPKDRLSAGLGLAFRLACAGCGEPVRLSRSRYRELIVAGRLPVCRKNGCYRYRGQLKIEN